MLGGKVKAFWNCFAAVVWFALQAGAQPADISYQGQLTLNFTLCPDVVADSDQLPELVHDSLEAIEKAAAELGPDQGHEQFPEPQHNLTDDVLAYVEKLLKGGLGKFRR